MSRKQKFILGALAVQPELTLDQAVHLIGANLYANERKHVGAVLHRMVERGWLVRVRRGVYRRKTFKELIPWLYDK